MSHAACTSFGGLFAVRFVLGVCEGSITAGFMIVSGMFYTRKEQTYRVGWWCACRHRAPAPALLTHEPTVLMNGTAQIIAGFLSFGALHIHTHGFEPWQWLMVITGTITLALALAYWFLFPDSPTSAWFLTPAERAHAVARLRGNQTGVENKHFKGAQVREALADPKTWLFALFAALDNVPNSLTNQRQLIVASFGFSQLQVTLLGCVDGLIEIVTIATGVWLAARWKDARAWVGAVYFLPNLVGAVLVNVLPWSDKIGLLFSVWITGPCARHPPRHVRLTDDAARRRRHDWVRARARVAWGRDSRTHEESDDERGAALCVLHRERGGAVHVAGAVQAAVRAQVAYRYRAARLTDAGAPGTTSHGR
jgi:ACS family allantoate permease-like MFS transporter